MNKPQCVCLTKLRCRITCHVSMNKPPASEHDKAKLNERFIEMIIVSTHSRISDKTSSLSQRGHLIAAILAKGPRVRSHPSLRNVTQGHEYPSKYQYRCTSQKPQKRMPAVIVGDTMQSEHALHAIQCVVKVGTPFNHPERHVGTPFSHPERYLFAQLHSGHQGIEKSRHSCHSSIVATKA